MAALFTSLAGVLALPATAAEQLSPAITNPIDGMEFHDLPYIDGTGEPGSTAAITDGAGTPICSATIDELGNFSCAGTQRLPAGSNELTITSTAPGGAQTVGNTVQVWGEYFPNVDFPEPGSMISTQPGFSGRALPGVDVTLFDAAGVPVCAALSDDWGAYQCIPAEPLPLGPLTLTPSMTVSGGVVAGDSVNWTVIAAPVITSPANGGIVGDLPVFTGTAEPGTDISIMHGRSGAVLCAATVGLDGKFSCAMTKKLMVGGLEVFPQTSNNGVGAVSGAIITVAVEVTPVILRPSEGGIVPGIATIEGVAGARSNVVVRDGYGNIVCSAKADENGAFACIASPALTPGAHTLTPVQTGFDGIEVKGAMVHVTVPGTVPGEAVPTPPAASTPVTRPATTPAPTGAGTTLATTNNATQGTIQATTQTLAATGAGGTALPAAVGGALLLLGGASLLARFRRRTHG